MKKLYLTQYWFVQFLIWNVYIILYFFKCVCVPYIIKVSDSEDWNVRQLLVGHSLTRKKVVKCGKQVLGERAGVKAEWQLLINRLDH